MHICCVHIDQTLDDTVLQEMMQYVTPEKRAKIQRFRKPIDAMRSLLGDLIIRFILCRHYGFHNHEIHYEHQEFGKPYLPEHPDVHFNISHSGDWVVGIVSTDLIGIDIEKITEVKENLTSLALTTEEHQQFQKLNETERNLFFFELWTLKESYVKATGKGLSEGLNTLQISRDNGNIHIEKDGKPILAYFKMLKCIEEHQLSLCSFSEHHEKDIRSFLLNEFIEEVKSLLRMSKGQSIH
ncbi:4'-phosphopantetheinyl transferase superfamily protein [Chryseobacterium sp. NRRL B-14859]|uniref:4'-phosphopantetheinyl transferase family protein n=1 Tax=Chryseobacterium sp. NRRL B-14859 TaxID=1562763 RepID=UPI003392AC8B